MNLSLGIIGLPNAGKSTLFNALTNQSIPAENFPFTTIDPNVGVVPIMDDRLQKIVQVEGSKKTVYSTVQFVDIAGLVKGASQGEGLGNQFLHHIREVDAIIHLLRSFTDSNVSHIDKTIDPNRDIQTVETELIIKDTDTIEKKLSSIKQKARTDPSQKNLEQFLTELLHHLNEGKKAISFSPKPNNELDLLKKDLFLLTDKPILYVVNESQERITKDYSDALRNNFGLNKESYLLSLDAKLEEDLSQLSQTDQNNMLSDLGLSERPLTKLIQFSQNILNLLTFFTANKNEAHSWHLQKGETVIKAAEIVHSDFAQNFIAADVIPYAEFIKAGGWNTAREKGKIRLEGRDYIVLHTDVINIRHNV